MNKNKEKQLNETYTKFIQASLYDLPLEALGDSIDQDLMGYGTTEDEKINNLSDYLELIKRQRAQAKDVADISIEEIPIHRKITDNGNTALIVEEFKIAMHLTQGLHPLHLRVTTVLEYKDERWVTIHFHSSLPEQASSEEDTWNIKEWKREKEKLEKLVDEKTEDLTRKNRELEIEAALERVRAKAMAMRSSEDISDATVIVFNELTKLGIEMERCGIVILHEDDPTFEVWSTPMSPKDKKVTEVVTGYLDANFHPMIKHTYDSWKKKETFSSYTLVGEEIKEYYDKLEDLPEYRFPKISKYPERQIINCFFFEHGDIFTYTTDELSEEEKQILHRFTRVFSLTYQRYNDLKNAEDRARKAQIEAALERVRARSMAMHKSHELQEVIHLLFKEIRNLGINPDSCVITINEPDNYDLNLWISNLDQSYQGCIKIPYFKHPIFESYKEARRNKIEFTAEVFSKKVKDSFMIHAFENSEIGKAPKKWKQTLINGKGYARSMCVLSNAGISINNYNAVSFSEEANDIILRFTRVFEQTYTRFLDLQKAEAQAREAQIETALERVRSRSMGMHNSAELQDVIHLVFKEIKKLGINADSCIININEPENFDINMWISNQEQTYSKLVNIPFSDHPIMVDLAEARKNKIELITNCYSKDESFEFFSNAFINSDLKVAPKKWQKVVLNATGYVRSMALNEHTGIGLNNYQNQPFTESENDILKRFARVFEQTYTRFLDLQKAEAQAREAQIEAALERVRSKTMAMHNSEDVGATIVTLFDEVLKLGLDDDIRCGIGILEGLERMETWSVTSYPNGEVDLKMGMLDMSIHPMLKRIKQAWKDGKSHYTDQMAGNRIVKYYTALNNAPDYSFRRDLSTLPPKEFHNSFSFSEGILFAFSPNPMSEEAALVLKRFARVFGQTYRRYIDLQKAEAQTREAQIEAALERIRAKALAMQSSSDLLEVSNVLRDQMGYLGQQELESSLIHIYNNSKTLESWYTFRSTETDSEKIVTDVAIIPVDSCEYIRETMEKYHSIEMEYTIVSEGKKLVEWYKVMVKVAPDTIEYDGNGKMIVPDILYYHHAKFEGGALLMISNEKPSEEAKELQRRAAKVFNLAYQRFLDFQQAEARAKESLKQASLDRVRGEIASMRSKDDLIRITPIIWQELIALGVPFIRCGVFIMDEKNKIIESHLSSPDGKSLGLLNLPFEADKVGNNAVKYWREGKIYTDHWNKDQFMKFMNKMVKLGRLDNPELYQGAASPPKSLDLHFVPFKQGSLYVGNTTQLSDEEIKLVKSLAETFSIAYARYEDFVQLEQAKNQIEEALGELKSTQTQLIHSEKMASLGELTAGIAHEIQNPLNFVNNFSEVSADLIEELNEELLEGNDDEVKEISRDLLQNLEKIHHHGQRASSIVKGMLEHSRTGMQDKELTDINVLADEYLRLAYHGLRAKDKSFNSEFKTELDEKLPKVKVISQDIGRVMLNLINNAFYAVSSKSKANRNQDYKPLVTVSTKRLDNQIEIAIQDNGSGIPNDVIDKIFQPFFTTKPTGQGTGLGLSLSYDIITQGHDGHLEVESNEGIGTRFRIEIPLST